MKKDVRAKTLCQASSSALCCLIECMVKLNVEYYYLQFDRKESDKLKHLILAVLFVATDSWLYQFILKTLLFKMPQSYLRMLPEALALGSVSKLCEG